MAFGDTAMTQPRISVIVPTYNRAQFLGECLESVLTQTLRPCEVIVVNDGSTDDTREILKAYSGLVQVIDKSNEGKSVALNSAMPRVTGDFVWILDDDDVGFPDALERLVAPLTQGSRLGFTFATYVLTGSDTNGRIAKPGRVFQLPEFPDEELFQVLLDTNWINHSGILVRTTCYRTVGLFDPELFRSQDYDMILRLSRHFRARRVLGPVYYYRQHNGLRGHSLDRFRSEDRVSKWELYDKRVLAAARRDTPIEKYVSPGTRSNSSREEIQCLAYLIRMGVMAHVGLQDEAKQDWAVALRLWPDKFWPNCALSGTDGMAVKMAVMQGGLWEGFTGDLLSLCRSKRVGPVLRLECARGLYWLSKQSVKEREYTKAFRLLVRTLQVLGRDQLASAVIYKVKRWAHRLRAAIDRPPFSKCSYEGGAPFPQKNGRRKPLFLTRVLKAGGKR